MTCWIDGSLRADPVAVSVHDAGLTVGLGVFETVAVVDGVPLALRRHLERLATGAGRLGLAPPSAEVIRAGVDAVVDAAPQAEFARLRITVTGGVAGTASTMITIAAARRRTGPASVFISPWRRNPDAPTAGIKCISYADDLLAARHATERGADEALWLDTAGRLSEGATSNVFVVRDGRLSTPSFATGCLPGILRGLVIEHSDAQESDTLDVADLRTADEAFLTSSLRFVQPIGAVDGVALPAAPGPVTRRVADTVAALWRRTVDP